MEFDKTSDNVSVVTGSYNGACYGKHMSCGNSVYICKSGSNSFDKFVETIPISEIGLVEYSGTIKYLSGVEYFVLNDLFYDVVDESMRKGLKSNTYIGDNEWAVSQWNLASNGHLCLVLFGDKGSTCRMLFDLSETIVPYSTNYFPPTSPESVSLLKASVDMGLLPDEGLSVVFDK